MAPIIGTLITEEQGFEKIMRIVILAQHLRVAGGLSVGTNILKSLRNVGNEHKYLVVLPAGLGYQSIRLPTEAQCIYFYPRSLIFQILYELFRLRPNIIRFKPDIIWGLSNIGINKPPCPQVLLIHNPHRVYSNGFAGPISLGKLALRILRNLYLGLHLKSTRLVFCQTEPMRKRLVKKYSYKGHTALMPNSISVNTLTKKVAVKEEPKIARVVGKFRLLTLTKYYPHKNLESIVDTFCKYRYDLDDVAVFLTICKEHGKRAQRLIQKIIDNDLTYNLICVGEIAQSDLALWFQSCDAMLFPTLLESFSSTYVEAMHFGLPIITSDLDFAHAVCDNAALYCDPWDIQSIRDAILTLKRSPEFRNELAERGYKRLKSICRPWDNIVAAALREIEHLNYAET